MAKLAKFLQGVAGAAGGAGLNVEEVFSTYLYDGNGSSNTITNGIDLGNEGGLVWLKSRSNAVSHALFDTERGGDSNLQTDNSNAAGSLQMDVFSGTVFNSDGFFLRTSNGTINGSGYTYASWTFRKAPKFFDVVTYTGNGTAGRTISHNLGSVPGMIIVKQYQAGEARPWSIYHRGIDSSAPEDYRISFTTGARVDDAGQWNDTAPTSSVFTVGDSTYVNNNGESYVAYLFAHNDGDGGFGPDGDADIIKCGSYTGNGSTDGTEVNLGFEPQWVLIKNSSGSYNWQIYDNMRGVTTGGNDEYLLPNSSGAEAGFEALEFNATGFKLKATGAVINGSGSNYIYIAIRRGPMAVPESATDVFQPHIYTGTGSKLIYDLSITPDMVINMSRTVSGDANAINDRLRGSGLEMYTDQTGAEYNATTAGMEFDYTNQIEVQEYRRTNSQNYLNLCWKRAPSFFDVVAYTGTGSARTVSHNLGVAPEMMWVKKRDQTENWLVYHSATGNTKSLRLNSNIAAYTDTNWNNTTPTDSVFSLGSSSAVNYSGHKFIAYLFASLDGISKVGSYTGTGAAGNQIDCGFSSGARFVLIKRSSGSQNWYVFDTERGIVAGNDPSLNLNDTSTEYSSFDYIDPYSSGFELASGNISTNASGQTYIFYAIA